MHKVAEYVKSLAPNEQIVINELTDNDYTSLNALKPTHLVDKSKELLVSQIINKKISILRAIEIVENKPFIDEEPGKDDTEHGQHQDVIGHQPEEKGKGKRKLVIDQEEMEISNTIKRQRRRGSKPYTWSYQTPCLPTTSIFNAAAILRYYMLRMHSTAVLPAADKSEPSRQTVAAEILLFAAGSTCSSSSSSSTSSSTFSSSSSASSVDTENFLDVAPRPDGMLLVNEKNIPWELKKKLACRTDSTCTLLDYTEKLVTKMSSLPSENGILLTVNQFHLLTLKDRHLTICPDFAAKNKKLLFEYPKKETELYKVLPREPSTQWFYLVYFLQQLNASPATIVIEELKGVDSRSIPFSEIEKVHCGGNIIFKVTPIGSHPFVVKIGLEAEIRTEEAIHAAVDGTCAGSVLTCEGVVYVNGNRALRLPLASSLPPVSLEHVDSLLNPILELHKSGVLHRDIKPTQYLIHEGKVKINDFGLSSFVKDHFQNESFNLGTPKYMSPRLGVGHKYDSNDDLLSFAIMVGRTLCPQQTRSLSNKQVIEGIVGEALPVGQKIKTLIASIWI